jgi:hypothetical protein
MKFVEEAWTSQTDLWVYQFITMAPLDPTVDCINDALQWCTVHFGHSEREGSIRWSWGYDRPYWVILFSGKSDAMVFKLRWC